MPFARSLFFIVLISLGFSSLFGTQETQFKYSYLPKQLYEKQLFPATILELNSTKEVPQFVFDSATVKPISNKPLVVRNANDSFYTFYFKADINSLELPNVTISKSENQTMLQGATIPMVKLKQRRDFSGVLAADMKIKTSQASTYDESNNLVTLSIEAFEANLEDMKIMSIAEDSIENISRDNAKVVGEYSAVVPADQKEFKFTYFNTIKGQFIYLKTPIIVKDYSVSTQSEINPKDDQFELFKKYTFIGLSVFFLLMFLWKRDIFYLLFGVLSLVAVSTFYIPKKQICIEQGSSLYILPTHTSRMSTMIDERFTTSLLGKRSDFNKIEYKNNIIGWVKDENLCKD